jgi:hypothetical protein
MTAEQDAELLAATWYAQPNDLIGGWCVMDVAQTPGAASRPEVADFTSQTLAAHIADLHNQHLAREDWHHAPDGSPYQRLRAYADGDATAPTREDVMELLRSFNAASAMNRVHLKVISRLKRRREAARDLAASGQPVPAQALLDALAVRRDEPAGAGD